MPSKVLVVSNGYPTPGHPSYGVFVRRCVDALQTRGCDVAVVGLGKQATMWRKLLAYLQFSARVNVALARGDYHCVYIHYPLHSLLAGLPVLLLRRHRLVFNFHGDDLVPIHRRHRWMKWLARPFFEGSATVLVPSGHFKRLFDAQYPHRPGGPAIVFGSGGVGLPYLQAQVPALQARGRSALFLSRWVEGKGWSDFLALARALLQRFPDFRFTLAGCGPDEDRIHQAVAGHGLGHAVTVVTSVTEESNLALYRTHRYFVFPTRFDESLGLVNLEAMACGCVVLSSAFRAADDYLSHGESGFVLDAQSFAELALHTVADLEADLSRAEDIVRRARSVAARMSQARASEELTTILGLA